MDIEQRRSYFICGCIPVRILLAASLFVVPEAQVTVASTILCAIGLSFAALYIFKLRMNAPEGGGKTWWNYLRPLHAVLYLFAAHFLFTGNRRYAFMALIIDVIVGMMAWISKK